MEMETNILSSPLFIAILNEPPIIVATVNCNFPACVNVSAELELHIFQPTMSVIGLSLTYFNKEVGPILAHKI